MKNNSFHYNSGPIEFARRVKVIGETKGLIFTDDTLIKEVRLGLSKFYPEINDQMLFGNFRELIDEIYERMVKDAHNSDS
jgi:hypothetical protein